MANPFLVTGGDPFSAFSNGTDGITGPMDSDAAVPTSRLVWRILLR